MSTLLITLITHIIYNMRASAPICDLHVTLYEYIYIAYQNVTFRNTFHRVFVMCTFYVQQICDFAHCNYIAYQNQTFRYTFRVIFIYFRYMHIFCNRFVILYLIVILHSKTWHFVTLFMSFSFIFVTCTFFVTDLWYYIL